MALPNLMNAQKIQTFTYYEDDSVKLELDLFLPANSIALKTPLLIFVHGGGFSGGNRNGGHSLSKYFAGRGIAAATISYTLYMKGKDFGCKGILAEKVKAIQIAANEVWLATSFFIKNQGKLNIDTARIFISGSSAGAETVFHAAFWNRSQMTLFPGILPIGFKYAGLVAGSGAIMDLNLIRKDNQIPVMMFHGDADPVVPYGTAAHHFCPPNAPGWLMLFGSKSIYEHMSNLNGNVLLITYREGNHSIAGQHFYDDQQPVLDFVQRISKGHHAQIHIIK